MPDLPPYVVGTSDRREFAIGGHRFTVGRSTYALEVCVPGIGRDGDYVPSDAPEPAALAALLAGIAGVEPIAAGCGPSFRVDSADVLALVERRPLAASPDGRYPRDRRSVRPASTDPLFRLVGVFPFPTSDHRLVWVDVGVPGQH